mgnify:CR=1 FL=1
MEALRSIVWFDSKSYKIWMGNFDKFGSIVRTIPIQKNANIF